MPERPVPADSTDRSVRIQLIQPHRDHVLLVAAGDFDDQGMLDLRRHLVGLFEARTRYVLADVAQTTGYASPVSAVLRAGAHHLQDHQGWLRVVGPCPGMSHYEASLGQVFTFYQLVRHMPPLPPEYLPGAARRQRRRHTPGEPS